MEYERQVASVRAQNALEGDFSISQAEMSSRQAMLENASDIKVIIAFLTLAVFWDYCLKFCPIKFFEKLSTPHDLIACRSTFPESPSKQATCVFFLIVLSWTLIFHMLTQACEVWDVTADLGLNLLERLC